MRRAWSTPAAVAAATLTYSHDNLPWTAPRPRRRPAAPLELERLAELTQVLAEALPLHERDLAVLLLRRGLASPPITFSRLARLYRSSGQKIPFGIVRCAGVPVGVSITSYGAATHIVAAAQHMTQHWGLAAVEAVAARAQSLAGRPVTEALARRVLEALPGVYWLDGAAHGWLTFLGAGASPGAATPASGGMVAAVHKVFTVAAAVRLDELRAALAKALPGVDEAPTRVLERYLADAAGCAIDDAAVVRGPAGGELTHGERTLVDLLRAAGGEAGVDGLRRDARAAAVPRTTVNRLLELSPLFLPAGNGRARLVGV